MMPRIPPGERPAPRLVPAALGAVLCAAAPAAAQQPGVGIRADTVSGRSQADHAATGVALGNLTLYPEVAVTLAYDDNVFRSDAPKRDDAFASLRPRLRLESNSPRYPATLEASAVIRRYARIETENSEQYAVTGDVAAEIAAGIRLRATAGYSRQLEPRGSAGDTLVGRPIAFNLFQAGIAASRDAGRVVIALGGDLSRYAYGKRTVNGVPLPQDFRDFRQRSGHLRVAYAAGPAIALFVRGAIQRSTYPNVRTLDRSSNGYSVLGGVELGLTSLVSGSLGIGYFREDFADGAFGDISGLDYDVALEWSPTPLVSLGVKGARSLQRSPFAGSAGGIRTSVAATADYELLRQLILSADLGIVRETYRDLDRNDRRAEAQLGARYLLSRLAALSLSLNYRRQASSGPTARDFGGFGGAIGVTLHR